MPVFTYTIAADQHRPSDGDGYVRAETIQQAVALVGHPEVNVYALPPDAAGRVILVRLCGGAVDIAELACLT